MERKKPTVNCNWIGLSPWKTEENVQDFRINKSSASLLNIDQQTKIIWLPIYQHQKIKYKILIIYYSHICNISTNESWKMKYENSRERPLKLNWTISLRDLYAWKCIPCEWIIRFNINMLVLFPDQHMFYIMLVLLF